MLREDAGLIRYRVTHKDGRKVEVMAFCADSLIRFLGEFKHMTETVERIEVQKRCKGKLINGWMDTEILENGLQATACLAEVQDKIWSLAEAENVSPG